MSEDNITLIRRGYKAYGRRDFPAGFALPHPEVAICQTAFLPSGGTSRSHAQARDFFHRLNEPSEAQLHQCRGAGDHCEAMGRTLFRQRSCNWFDEVLEASSRPQAIIYVISAGWQLLTRRSGAPRDMRAI
jgi:hypothetical protein